MAEPAKNFDFDIQLSDPQSLGDLYPGGEAAVNFQVQNSGDRKRAEVILKPIPGPVGPEESWVNWLHLDKPREHDYQPLEMQHYTVKITVPDSVVPGTYSFQLLVAGHDDPEPRVPAQL